MRILLTNDDGINARGIGALRDTLSEFADVFLVAPETEMSAVGHAITLTDPLRVREVRKNGGVFGMAVNGTPADCVKIAVRAILDEKPDIVVSGINHGQNVATNVIYSGTVSAATEGMILGIPSVAISLSAFEATDFSFAASFGASIVKKVANNGLPDEVLLNVNIPYIEREMIKGVRICRMGISKFVEKFEKRLDPRNNIYYWQGGSMKVADCDHDADITYLKNGWITITPIRFDLTYRPFIEELENWNIGID